MVPKSISGFTEDVKRREYWFSLLVFIVTKIQFCFFFLIRIVQDLKFTMTVQTRDHELR